MVEFTNNIIWRLDPPYMDPGLKKGLLERWRKKREKLLANGSNCADIDSKIKHIIDTYGE